jgi:pyruvate formate lyase activating enzyme
MISAKKPEAVEQTGLLFDIQGFSVHDGPGCRTVIFLKGCPLRCNWCANPEGIVPYRQVLYSSAHCIQCHSCQDGCRSRAIQVHPPDFSLTIDDASCRQCVDFECVDTCNYEALNICGYDMAVNDLMKRIQRDRQYWGTKGGVTLSGGEPMGQYEFSKTLLKRCCDSFIHTCLETSGHAPWEYFEGVLDYLDWILFDLKHMDTEKHQARTGVPNKLILDNARKLSRQAKAHLVFRMPIIPGYNDSSGNIKKTAEFLKSIDCKEINILPLHHLGSTKYDRLRWEYNDAFLETPSPEHMRDIGDLFSKYSITCYIGPDTPF